MKNNRFMLLLVAMMACLSSSAQMKFSFSGVDVSEETLSDGSTLITFPAGTDLNALAALGMSATVDGQSVELSAITPNPATTFVTNGEIEVFVYDGKAYSFRFVNSGYSSYLLAYFNDHPHH